jgi:hypothetical protein
MDVATDIFAGLGGLALLVLIVLAVLLPYSAYSAQKWAHRCYKELVKMNEKLDKLGS